MNLRNYIAVLRRRRWIIAVTIITAAIVGVVGVLLIRPVYTASSTLRFTPRGITMDYGMLEYAVRLKNTFADLAVSDPTLMEVERRLGVEVAGRDLRDAIIVEFPSNNELMSVTARDSDPNTAANIANTVSAILIEQSQASRGGRSFTLDLIAPAIPPERASIVTSLISIIAIAVISLIAGLGLALLMESLDRRVHTAEQVEDITRMPVLIQVPNFRSRKSGYITGEGSGEAEAFRQLRTLLHVRKNSPPHKLIAITSAAPGEGKSLIAANLARSFAMLGQRVVLVDCDLRRPKLHEIFHLPNDVGVSNVLKSQVEVGAALRHVPSHNLYVLPSGQLPNNPAELLGSPAAQGLWKQLGERFDLVLLDSPAFLAVTDAMLLATQADGVLFVVRYAHSNSESVRTAYTQLATVGANVIGIIANGADQNPVYQYYKKA
jgi:capsular exopolysaccharide synthesis family protein